jgi:hypothetical protein
MAAQWGGVQLGDLLVAAWTLHIRSEGKKWGEAEQRAAQKCLEECDGMDVLIKGYERFLYFTNDRTGDCVEFEPDTTPCLIAANNPTSTQRAAAMEEVKRQWKIVEAVARGEGSLIWWGGTAVDMRVWDRGKSPIGVYLAPPLNIATTPWMVAVEQVVKFSQFSGVDEDRLKLFVEQVRCGELEVSTRVSGEIARLDSTNCTQSILSRLEAELPGEIEEMRLPLPSRGDSDRTHSKTKGGTPERDRRTRPPRKSKKNRFATKHAGSQ